MVAWSRVLAKFKIKVLNFPQPPYFTFTFHTSSCCHHLALLPDHGMPPWDLLPPSAALYGEATWYCVSPSLIPPLSFTGAGVAHPTGEQSVYTTVTLTFQYIALYFPLALHHLIHHLLHHLLLPLHFIFDPPHISSLEL